MSDTRLHDELVEQYGDEYTPTEAREETLTYLSYNQMRSVSAMLNLHAGNDKKPELRRKLAEAGVFHGGIGDENLYRYTGDDVKVVPKPAE